MTEPGTPTTDSAATGVSAVDATRFRDAMARLPTGVAITTTLGADGTPHGFTAGSLVSVSLNPRLIAVCVGQDSNCYSAFAMCEQFAVSVLGAEHGELARTFASKGVDKFAHGRFVHTPGGLLVVDGARVTIECLVHARHPAGDHVILVGDVCEVHTAGGEQLVFSDRQFTSLGVP